MEGQNQGAEAAPDFTKAETWADVMNVLYAVEEGVQGSQDLFPIDVIKAKMAEYASAMATGNTAFAEDVLNEITSAGGLRDAVVRATAARLANPQKQ